MSKKRVKSPPSWLVEGAMVDYHAVIGGPVTMYNVRVRIGPPQQLSCGAWVVWLDGKAGCVSVDACTPATGSLGPSNDDSPAVQQEIKAARFLGHPRNLPDAWDAGSGGVEFWTSERIADAWAWDTSRPLADQFAETAELDAQADREEARSARNTAALIADFNAKGPTYSALCDAFDAEDDYDPRAGGPALTTAEVAAYLDAPLTVTIDAGAVEIHGLYDAAAVFSVDEAEALANDLLLGADAALQTAQDGYHGPAVVVDLVTGEESEHGVKIEVQPVICTAPHGGDCAPSAWGDGPMVCVVPLRALAAILSAADAAECEQLSGSNVCQACGDKWTVHGQTCSGSMTPSPDSIPILAGAPEAIGLTPRQLREQAAAAVAAEDALWDPEVTARNAARLTVHPTDDNCKLLGASGCHHDDMSAEETQAVFGEERGDG